MLLAILLNKQVGTKYKLGLRLTIKSIINRICSIGMLALKKLRIKVNSIGLYLA
jgi:hypothetical protein